MSSPPWTRSRRGPSVFIKLSMASRYSHFLIKILFTAVEGSLAPPERPPLGYVLAGLPEVTRVGQPPVQLGQSLQHVGQLGEGHPVFSFLRPAGGQDLLLHRENGTDTLGNTDTLAAVSGLRRQ